MRHTQEDQIVESPSSCTFSALSGDSIFIWTTSGESETSTCDLTVSLEPGRPIIIGRAHNHEVEYLDPVYRPTAILPTSGQCVLHATSREQNSYLSRGHFMLKDRHRGIVFVNGVPGRNGSIRPPTNGTRMIDPDHRSMAPAEEYFIESGKAIVIELPNGSSVRISAA